MYYLYYLNFVSQNEGLPWSGSDDLDLGADLCWTVVLTRPTRLFVHELEFLFVF